MKVSYKWLQNYFEKKLPKPDEVARLLTMHSFEIEGLEKVGSDTVLDVKVLPNLAHSCLSHNGIARELSAILNIIKKDSSLELKDFSFGDTNKKLTVDIKAEIGCHRYIGRVVEDIKVGPSPKWLVDALHAIGQKSINNIVDATNFVMYDTGQPLHAFDADKLSTGDIAISVENAVSGTMTTLDNKEVKLDPSVLLITSSGKALALAGIKGGKEAEIDEKTKNIVIESANFDPVMVRKTSRRLNIITDSSKRFENEISPELALIGMDMVTRLIASIAGSKDTKISHIVDIYKRRANAYKVGVSLSEINGTLGTDISGKELIDILSKTGLPFEKVKPIEKILSIAQDYVGAPYMYGASVSYDAPKAFDCSSLIAYLYVQGGIAIPRLSVEQYIYGKTVEESNLQPGDLVFLKGRRPLVYKEVPDGVGHVGMYLGDGKIIHASGPSHHDKVVVDSLAEFEAAAKAMGEFRGYRRMITSAEERFVITIPSERLDLRIKEDVIEEIGRIYGYEKIPSIPLPEMVGTPIVHKGYYYANKIRGILSRALFTEISTYAMVDKGKVEILNPMSGDKASMRANLSDAMKSAFTTNARNADLAGVSRLRLFEIGKVFDTKDEYTHLCIGVCSPGVAGVGKKDKEIVFETKTLLAKELGLPVAIVGESDGILEIDLDAVISELPEPAKIYDTAFSGVTRKFEKVSVYPFMSRDIAVFLPEGTTGESLEKIFMKFGTSILVHYRCFDVFTKTFPDGTKKTSYAYRLVFQSTEKTLADTEVASAMDTITESIKSQVGWEVR